MRKYRNDDDYGDWKHEQRRDRELDRQWELEQKEKEDGQKSENDR